MIDEDSGFDEGKWGFGSNRWITNAEINPLYIFCTTVLLRQIYLAVRKNMIESFTLSRKWQPDWSDLEPFCDHCVGGFQTVEV